MEEEKTLYDWAFVAGLEIIKQFEKTYREPERVEKRFETLMLNLRSEMIPERFRRALMDIIVEVKPNVGIRQEIKVERPWKIEEFYRYSVAILAGLHDSLQKWKKEREKPKQGGGNA
ncbi:MAG: hypothetical protein QW356_05705 [Candidatus Hadarchaeales archaeon]